ncbi:hypothetical protein SAMN06265222_105276 [Neorhodopirellula lusitana]|uniref:Uncharacterized protein n=1 Tax=Neorhodopirellula lusitana TaxID=445327 RepID=A0ABY1Q2F2_9BACT|nr:hypothetical protein [Neorhodopirellula lusitana]SMP57191.1 hypothetical protein SAMN06265222_105276 [Neorhodopirellula lusitana]
MASAPEQLPSDKRKNSTKAGESKPGTSMRATWADSLHSFLLASVFLLSAIVGLLYVIWSYSQRDPLEGIEVPPVRFVTSDPSGQDGDAFDTPSRTETALLEPMTLEQRLDSLAEIPVDSDAPLESADAEPTLPSAIDEISDAVAPAPAPGN